MKHIFAAIILLSVISIQPAFSTPLKNTEDDNFSKDNLRLYDSTIAWAVGRTTKSSQVFYTNDISSDVAFNPEAVVLSAGDHKADDRNRSKDRKTANKDSDEVYNWDTGIFMQTGRDTSPYRSDSFFSRPVLFATHHAEQVFIWEQSVVLNFESVDMQTEVSNRYNEAITDSVERENYRVNAGTGYISGDGKSNIFLSLLLKIIENPIITISILLVACLIKLFADWLIKLKTVRADV
jgi:hypothetical protein